MSFKKNLLLLVIGGWLSTFSQLDAQIRRPGSENDPKQTTNSTTTVTTPVNTTKTGSNSNSTTTVTNPASIPTGANSTGAQSNSSNAGSNNNANTTPPSLSIVPKVTIIQKPKKGNYNVEAVVQLGGNGIGIGVNEIKGRYFYSDKRNYRLRLSGVFNNDLNDISPNKTTKAEVSYDEQKLLIAGGIEEHYQNSNRVNTFLGFEAGGRYEKESTVGLNSKDGISFFQGYTYEKTFTESAIFLNGVTGIDYYLNSQFYIGAELMVGVSNHTTKYTGIKISTADGIESQDGFYSGGGFEARLTYSNGIRLGYKF